jgi:pilus assembly protein CpaC
VLIHKSILIHLEEPVTRVSTGDPEIADILLINPTELYVLGKSLGTTNLVAWGKQGRGVPMDIAVLIDTASLTTALHEILPDETQLHVSTIGNSIVLSGPIQDGYRAERAIALAESLSKDRKIINLMRTTAPQQVLLEVKIAEVSKTLVDQLGADYSMNHIAAGTGLGWGIAGGYLTGAAGIAQLLKPGLTTSGLKLDANNKHEIVKVLAEPNIMAISGQEGSFLAGGKIYFPIPQGVAGSMSITLEEKEYGIGIRFTPTVLEDGRINLRVSPEVSDINQQGIVITALGAGQSVLPSITTRRASTTVQLRDGQTFAIGGLIKNNVIETVKRFPALGDLPILGALFRSSSFQNDKTELLFIITAHLVKPLGDEYRLPTDGFIPPGKIEFLINGRMEGQTPTAPPPKKQSDLDQQ